MYAIIPELNVIGEVEALNVEADTYKKYDSPEMDYIAYARGRGTASRSAAALSRRLHLQALYNFNYDNQLDDYGNNVNPNGLFLGQPLVVRLTFL
jgi:hypothetical protein